MLNIVVEGFDFFPVVRVLQKVTFSDCCRWRLCKMVLIYKAGHTRSVLFLKLHDKLILNVERTFGGYQGLMHY
jgi:hypothetical protein